MKSVILLNSSENTSRIEAEEQAQFIRSILEIMELPLDNIWDENGELLIDGKIKLRNILSTYNIQIIDNSDGEIQIYCDAKLIGEWKKSEYILKQDLQQKDPKKKLYLEMHANCWSIFDNQEE